MELESQRLEFHVYSTWKFCQLRSWKLSLRLDLQAQNQVFETQDVIKLITFEIGPTIYIVEKLGLVTHFRPNDTMLNVLLSPIALTTEQVAC